eukprot:CAMPEP_0195582286 /NCGR_PEP_ID=MMETSP0814-20130614/21880_1 /TAXON_ID=97485 /ORGANISM="Prymnesium parvum, Strain Texoma1" /LENGTH=33 /DNA_ID= /DNA_START= /DNA_END= /DNA_ORIENTATION=
MPEAQPACDPPRHSMAASIPLLPATGAVLRPEE